MWGIHNDHPDLDLIGNGFVSVGWDDVGDLHAVGPDKEAMKQKVAATRPTAKPGAIPVWAGVLMRFAFEMKPGDLVVYPYKPDSTCAEVTEAQRPPGAAVSRAGADDQHRRRQLRGWRRAIAAQARSSAATKRPPVSF